MPRRCTTDCGNTREENALRKMSSNCLSRPPIPSFSNENSLVLNKFEFTAAFFWPTILIAEPCAAAKTTDVSGVNTPRNDVTPSGTSATSMEDTVNR